MKNYLVPHKGNKYNPHIFKTKNIMLLFLVAVIVAFVSYLGTVVMKNTGLLASIQSAFLVDLTNKDRLEKDIATLTLNPVLVEAAQRKANDMASKGYFAHTSPEGITPWQWFKDVNYSYIYAGENLAVNFTESVDVHKAWIASPTHKKNILDQRFTEIGIATAEGFYKGRKATFVVQMFGKPKNSLFTTFSNTTPQTVPLVVSGPDSKTVNSSAKVFGVQDEKTSFSSETNIVERLIVSPLSVGRIILVGMGIMVLVALLLRITIEYKRHHFGRTLLLSLLLVFLVAILIFQKNFLRNTEIIEESSSAFSEV